ncbi:MAG: Gfo/Idh/MocA family oxidoreductase [Desulfocapsaceae bacterium]|nr:Gfo/Idh/MocA family oxidoreductase [Desulfocapsaceae bacterium]
MVKEDSTSSSKTPMRVGVVGVGYLGKFHAEKYARHPDVELVGVVDSQAEQADKIAKQTGCQSFYNHKELFGKVDAVSIAVPTEMHFTISRDFIREKVDVLIEKPITSTVEEADSLLQLADEHGVLIQVGQLERFNPAVVALEDRIKKPLFIESHRLSKFKPRSLDVSVVLDLMIHDIDIILNLVQSKIRNIHAAGIPVITDNIDIANARLEFESGCIANVTASRISMKNERKIRLFQKDAYISIDFAEHGIVIVERDEEQKQNIIPGMSINKRDFTDADALDQEIRSFVEAVTHKKEPKVTGRMGRDALEIAHSVMEQIQQTSERLIHTQDN